MHRHGPPDETPEEVEEDVRLYLAALRRTPGRWARFLDVLRLYGRACRWLRVRLTVRSDRRGAGGKGR